MRLIRHIIAVGTALFLCLGVPCLYFIHTGGLAFGKTDAVSGASLVVPDQPSGTFLVLVNRQRHPETIAQWTDFFTEKDVDVIMEDIHCLITKGDVSGKELAERYQARLAENQMQITQEDGTLVASRAENGLFDVVLISEDAARVYDYSHMAETEQTAVITVTGDKE